MKRELIDPNQDISVYGPAMQALTVMQRDFVIAYCEHPTYSATQVARIAGYSDHLEGAKVRAHELMHNEKVLAAINEMTSKRMRGLQINAISAIADIINNPLHKDHLKATIAILDRTGHHALSEHKVTVDDKRPETHAEVIAAIKRVAKEVGFTDEQVLMLAGSDTKDNAIDAEFAEVDIDQDIQQQMDDL